MKKVFKEINKELDYLKRLAFFTLNEESAKKSTGVFDIHFSKDEDIDCIIEVEEQDIKKFNESLDCYKSYKEVIEKTGVRNHIGNKVYFEIFQDNFDPPVSSLSEKLDS